MPNGLTHRGSGEHVLQKAWEAKRNRRTCKRGHPLRPYDGSTRRCAVCDRERNALRGRQPHSGKLPEATVRQALEALHDGTPISHLGGLVNGKYVSAMFIVRPKALLAFCRVHPKLGRPILKLIKRNSDVALAEVRRKGNIACWGHAAPAIVTRTDDVLAAIQRAVAAAPSFMREDIAEDITLEIYDRRLPFKRIRDRVRQLVTQYNRLQYVPGRGGGKITSLDLQLFDDGPMTLGDTVTTSLWEGWETPERE